CDIPALNVAGEQKLELQFMFVLLPQGGVGIGEIGLSVVPFDFLQNLVGTADLPVFDIEHWIDEVFAPQQAKAVFQPKPSKYATVGEGRLAVHIKRSRPPSRGAVFQFRPEGVKVVAATLRA